MTVAKLRSLLEILPSDMEIVGTVSEEDFDSWPEPVKGIEIIPVIRNQDGTMIFPQDDGMIAPLRDDGTGVPIKVLHLVLGNTRGEAERAQEEAIRKQRTADSLSSALCDELL